MLSYVSLSNYFKKFGDNVFRDNNHQITTSISENPFMRLSREGYSIGYSASVDVSAAADIINDDLVTVIPATKSRQSYDTYVFYASVSLLGSASNTGQMRYKITMDRGEVGPPSIVLEGAVTLGTPIFIPFEGLLLADDIGTYKIEGNSTVAGKLFGSLYGVEIIKQ